MKIFAFLCALIVLQCSAALFAGTQKIYNKILIRNKKNHKSFNALPLKALFSDRSQIRKMRDSIIEDAIMKQTPFEWYTAGTFWLVISRETIFPNKAEIISTSIFKAPHPFDVRDIPWLSSEPNYNDRNLLGAIKYEIYEYKEAQELPVLVHTLRGHSIATEHSMSDLLKD